MSTQKCPHVKLRKRPVSAMVTGVCALAFLTPAYANDTHITYSPNIYGALGLNTVPSARMQESGTISAGISTLDPYVHGFLGFQIASPLYIALRQSAEVSDVSGDADRLYPGLDLKLRLINEARYRPAISIGLQSATGHKRLAGEYLALSKRIHNVDLTAGLGWGRFGSAGHFNNPLKGINKHFGKLRALDGEEPNKPADWFTGEKIGIFGGLEYFTSIKGLSVKLDYGADRYSAETAATDFEKPAPWAAGLNYQPRSWINISAGVQGTDKILGRLSLHPNPANFPSAKNSRIFKEPFATVPMRPYRTDLSLPVQMELAAQRESIALSAARHSPDAGIYGAEARLNLSRYEPAPQQLKRAFTHMANHAGPATEELKLFLEKDGLSGPSISIIRSDLENALTKKQGSPQEIWRNAVFGGKKPDAQQRHTFNRFSRWNLDFILDNQVSLAEEDSGFLYRTSVIAETRTPKFLGLLTAIQAVRINITDNLDRLAEIRPRSLLPVRSDVDLFANDTFSLERSTINLNHSFTPEFHASASAGILEEMYAGLGGEILYRPFGSRFAIGGEAWQTFRRDPASDYNLALNGDHILTGHVNGWYLMPRWDLTLSGKLGRYLAGDVGATIGLDKEYKNGARLSSFFTLSDSNDFDLFGGTTQAYHGIKLTLPLGYTADKQIGARARFNFTPLGRDIGQTLDKPTNLYEETESFSLPHMSRYWTQITDQP